MREMFWKLTPPNGFPENTQHYILNDIVANRPNDLMPATIGTDGKAQDSTRTSRVMWLSGESWLRDYLYDDFIQYANREAFGFDIQKICDIQYTEYHAEEGGKYDWHTDVFWHEERPFDRKLSMTIQLSESDDYEGGDFEFNECENPENSRTRGTVLVFPSYLQHRVTPITKGVRKSLVAWFEGPRWK